MKIAVLDDYFNCAMKLAPFETLQEEHELKVFDKKIPDRELADVLGGFDVLLIMRERTAFPAALIRRLPNLKLIVTTGRRNDVVDLDACKAANITVCGTDSPPYPAAELTFALIMAAGKGIITEHNSMRAGGWQTGLSGDMQGKTLGIIGLGRLGGKLAGYANALGMNLIGWSKNLTAERAAECSAEAVTKDDLMSRSDFISIHLRLSERTHHLIGKTELAKMKDGAWLVNTSRAPIIEMDALMDELRTGRINAALDVFDTEPLPEDSELRTFPNVILSPHKGYVSRDTFRTFYQQTYAALIAWLGNKPINLIV